MPGILVWGTKAVKPPFSPHEKRKKLNCLLSANNKYSRLGSKTRAKAHAPCSIIRLYYFPLSGYSRLEQLHVHPRTIVYIVTDLVHTAPLNSAIVNPSNTVFSILGRGYTKPCHCRMSSCYLKSNAYRTGRTTEWAKCFSTASYF